MISIYRAEQASNIIPGYFHMNIICIHSFYVFTRMEMAVGGGGVVGLRRPPGSTYMLMYASMVMHASVEMDLNKIIFSILNFNQTKKNFVSNACMIQFVGWLCVGFEATRVIMICVGLGQGFNAIFPSTIVVKPYFPQIKKMEMIFQFQIRSMGGPWKFGCFRLAGGGIYGLQPFPHHIHRLPHANVGMPPRVGSSRAPHWKKLKYPKICKVARMEIA